MAEGEDGGEKIHDPTPKRLADARERGEVPQSHDLTTAATYGGFLLACVISGPSAVKQLGQAGTVLLEQADRTGTLLANGATAPMMGILTAVGSATWPFFLLPAAAAFLAMLGQNSLTFAPGKLAPRLSRLNPFAALAHKFGPDGLFEFGKSAVKLCVVSGVLGVFLVTRLPDIFAAADLDPALSARLLLDLSVVFLCLVALIAAVIGAGDLLWQRHRHLQRNRMSQQEMIEEFRLSEGDPQTKAQRRQRGEEIAANRMLLDVPRSSVVIVNPQHFAVALRWDRGKDAAPVCVAKGVDAVAARIRESAAEAGVPIHRDPPTARALYAATGIGQQIHPDHYRAVAAAIRFAEAMRQKAKGPR
jgi:flagellar biosynthetic protein FlhB